MNNTWVIPQNQFKTTPLIQEGAVWSFATGGIVIPSSGYYEITIVNYFSDITTDRGSIITALAINGSYSDEDYICGSYVRFDSGMIGSRGNSGTIFKYLNQNDQVCTAWYETGDSTYVSLGTTGSSFTIRKIG